MEIDMQAIATLVTAAGIPARVEQTGGGTATIYVGGGTGRYLLIAGPGWFDGPGWSLPKGDNGDFYIGPDDDGESEPMSCDDMNEVDIAAKIVKLAQTKEYIRKSWRND